jgi:hypothetical protein
MLLRLGNHAVSVAAIPCPRLNYALRLENID